MLDDQQIQDEVACGRLLILTQTSKIPNKIREAKGHRQLITASLTVDLSALDDLSINPGHIVATDLGEVRPVIEPDEGNNGHDGDYQHENLLVAAENGKHR